MTALKKLKMFKKNVGKIAMGLRHHEHFLRNVPTFLRDGYFTK